MKADAYKGVFRPDSGALLDIRVFETTPKDWQMFLDYVSSHHEVSYAEDGQGKPLPKFEVISDRRNLAAASLQIRLSGITLNCHFFEVGQMEMDVLPEDVNTSEKAQWVFDFMVAIARLLSKEVFLTPEFGSATQTELKDSALCLADPQNGSIRHRLADGSGKWARDFS